MKTVRMVSAAAAFMLLSLLLAFSSFAEEKALYLKNGGTGDGSSENEALGSFSSAVAGLKNGGTVVICGEYSFSEYIGLSDKSGTANDGIIKVTSVYGGVDHRRLNGACFCFGNSDGSANLSLAGSFVFEELDFVTAGSSKERAIICNANSVTFGDGIRCEKTGDAPYLSIVGASFDDDIQGDFEIKIKSGTYNRLYCAGRGAPFSGNVFLSVEGGVFDGEVSLSGRDDGLSDMTGNVEAFFAGGSFRNGIGTFGKLTGNAKVRVERGFFKGDVVLTGDKNELVIDGGDFSNVSSFVFTAREGSEPPENGGAAEYPSEVFVNGVAGKLSELTAKLEKSGAKLTVSETAKEYGVENETQDDTDETLPETGDERPAESGQPEKEDGKETGNNAPGDGENGFSAAKMAAIIASAALATVATAIFLLRRNRIKYDS